MIDLPACKPIAAYKDLTEEQWKELRKTGIGGSDAGYINGHSKYGSPLTVCLEKTGRYVPDDISGEEPIEVGKILEPIIRREIVGPYIKEKEGIEVEVIDPTHTYRSLEYDFMLANTDGFLFVPETIVQDPTTGETIRVEPARHVILEIKTGSSYVLKDWGGKDGDEIPDSYYDQVQHYMAVTGLNEAWVFALIGNERVLRKVPKNEPYITDLIAKEREVWEAVKINDPLYFPLPAGLDAEGDALMQFGDPQSDEVVDLSDMQDDIDRYLQLKVQIDDLSEERKMLNQRIRFAMERSKYAETDQYKLTFSRFERSSIDRKRLEKDYPEIAEQYLKKSESGRLSVKSKT